MRNIIMFFVMIAIHGCGEHICIEGLLHDCDKGLSTKNTCTLMYADFKNRVPIVCKTRGEK